VLRCLNPRASNIPTRNHRSKPPPSKPPPSPPPPPRKGIYIASGLFIYTLTAYTVYLYTTLSASPPAPPSSSPSPDHSPRYNTTAPTYDASVSLIEATTGINRRRRTLISQAHGHVLEACAGTGRNALWYDMQKVRSVAFVDKSGPMLEIARKKWRGMYPRDERAGFWVQGVGEPLPIATENENGMPREGFTTIVQTMGICSTPDPSATLAHLGTLAHPTDGRILLLEHGRGHYGWINWILDRSAARHAEKHGCWYNRDVGAVVAKSGLVVEKAERSQFGTLWYVEARPAVVVVTGEAEQEEGATKAETEGEQEISDERNRSWLAWPKW